MEPKELANVRFSGSELILNHYLEKTKNEGKMPTNLSLWD